MNTKVAVQNISTYFQRFGRIFLSESCFTSPSASLICDALVSANLPKGIIVLNETAYRALAQNRLVTTKLLSSGLLKTDPKTGKITVIPTTYIKAFANIKSKKATLLITCNDNEGYTFKKFDYEDNHVNDIEACTIDSSGKCFIYKYEPPKELITFRIKTTFPVDKLKVVFYKTTITGYLSCLYTEEDSRIDAVKKNNQEFSYVIDKSLLFESDKIQFIVEVGSTKLRSNQLDYYFEDEQLWTIKQFGNGLLCSLDKEEDIVKKKPVEEEKEENDVPSNEIYPYYGGKKVSLPTDVRIDAAPLQEGSVVYTGRKAKIVLRKELGRGGEGYVYATDDPNIVVKILFNTSSTINLSRNRKNKIEFMTSHPINNSLIVWPKDAVYNSSNIFVGFTMPSAIGKEVNHYISQIRPDTGFGIYNLTKVQLVQMIVSILETFVYLHKRNIIVGDIKMENLMIKNQDFSKVYFVDCDSYQIDKFPATKTSPGYTAPELSGDVSQYYRTFGNEYYSLFVLLFKILLKGNNPYVCVADNQATNELNRAKQGNFPYTLNEQQTNANINQNVSKIAWSHLPGYIKKAFIEVAHKTGKNFGPNKRLDASEWLKLFNCYLRDLKSGRLNKDPQYNVALPDPTTSQPIMYSLVDISAANEKVGIQKEFSLSYAINRIITKTKLSYTPSQTRKIYSDVYRKGRYSDDILRIDIKKNIGVYYELEYGYVVDE